MKNKLTTLLFADVAGYTRLIEINENQTTIDIKSVFSEIIIPKLEMHNGRIVHHEGDGFFSEFLKPEAAVLFSIEIQESMRDFNSTRAANQLIQIRIGINHGHVLIDPDTKFLSGIAVNIAARLETLADVGGIWVTESIVKNVKFNDSFDFISLGSRRLKNVPGRVSIFGVTWENSSVKFDQVAYSHENFRTLNSSVAILPFRVLIQTKGKTDAEVLSHSIVEDIMTELGRFSEVTIIAPEYSTFNKENEFDVKQVGRILAVDYLITGSILQNSESIRIHARLFETMKGQQIWASRYDSKLNDIFTLQDKIAHDLAGKLPLRIESEELITSRKKPFVSLDSYDCYIQGRELYRKKTERTDKKAIKLLERAINLDPEFADPYTILGAIHGINWAYSSWGINPVGRIMKGRNLILKALSLNNKLPRAHAHLGWTYLSTGEFSKAKESFDKAISQNPNDADILLLKAYAIMYMGESSESVRICEQLIDLNPKFPDWYIDVLGGAHFIIGNYDEALPLLKRVSDLFPECDGWIAACQAHLGKDSDAHISAENFIKNISTIWKGSETSSSEDYVSWFLKYACPFMFEKDTVNMAEGLLKSGLPVPDFYMNLINQNNTYTLEYKEIENGLLH